MSYLFVTIRVFIIKHMAFTVIGLDNTGELKWSSRQNATTIRDDLSFDVHDIPVRRLRNESRHLWRKQSIFENHFSSRWHPANEKVYIFVYHRENPFKPTSQTMACIIASKPPSGASIFPETGASRTWYYNERSSLVRLSDRKSPTSNSVTFSERLIWCLKPYALTHGPV